MQPYEIRQVRDGTIDYAFYRTRAAHLRTQRVRRTARTVGRLLPVVIGVVIGLLLGLTVATRAEQKHASKVAAVLHHVPEQR
jgi:hypothetical protein